MAFGRLAEGGAMFSSTPVENMFMLEFMPNAPGDFVRVYLYGLMQCHHPELAEDIEGVAKALNMEPETVLNACRYWEREGLIVRMSDNPPTFVFHSCQEALNARPQIEKEYYEDRDFNSGLQDLFGEKMLLHPKEYTMASDWVEVMKLPREVVLTMVRRELQRTKKKTLQSIFHDLDKRAMELADREIRTVEDAEAYLDRDEAAEKCARAVIEQFSFNRNPSKPEVALAAKWLNEWHYSQEAVLEACERTVNSGNPSFKYLDTILNSQHEKAASGEEIGAETLRGWQKSDTEERSRIKALLTAMKQASPVVNEKDIEYFRAIMQGGFEYDVVLMAANAGRARTMEQLQRLLFKWAEQGIFTMEAYERFRQQRGMLDKLLEPLFERAGIERNPRQSDRDLMEKWQQHHSMEMILLAGELSRGTDTPMRYIDATLARWQRDGVTTPEAARSASRPGNGAKQDMPREAGQFAQREYVEGDYQKLVTDLGLDDDEEDGE